jgi:hypothetical protein
LLNLLYKDELVELEIVTVWLLLYD